MGVLAELTSPAKDADARVRPPPDVSPLAAYESAAEMAVHGMLARPPAVSAAAAGRLLQRTALSHPVNASSRAAALRETQHVHGNRIAQRVVARAARPAVGDTPLAQRTCSCGGTCDACSDTHDASHEESFVPTSARGTPLDRTTREFMESRFGYDFSDVRVHTDAAAARAAQALDATAYTVDKNIVFGAGQYVPDTSEGRRLIAHELVHTVQQTGDLARQALDFGPPPPDRPLRPHLPSAPPGAGHGAAVTVPPSTSGPACWTGDVCAKPVPGSASEFSADVDKQLAQKKAPTRLAPALTTFANAESPGLISGARIIVNPNLGGTGAGGQADTAAKTIEVLPGMESEAAEFNAVPKVDKIGAKEKSRPEWRFEALRTLTHEMAHIRFAAAPPTGLPSVGSIAMFELDELNAQLSEFPLGYQQVMSTEPVEEARNARIQRAITRYINKRGEGIRGILSKLRCTVSCDAVNTAVRRVFEAQTASWPREMRDVLLTALADPANRIQWPMPPAPRVEMPATKPSEGMGGIQRRASRDNAFGEVTDLPVSMPGDPCEVEAERVADDVMRAASVPTTPDVEHTCDCGGTCAKCSVQRLRAITASPRGRIWRSPDPDEEETTADVEEPTVDAEAFVQGTIGGPPEDADEALRQKWVDQIEYFLQRADADFITGMLGIVEGDEFDYWEELEESAILRAYHLRAALVLRDGKFATEAELDALIEHTYDTAEDEAKTLEEEPSFADQYPEAFPATWAERVETHLKPPADLELDRAESAFTSIARQLSDDMEAIAPDVFEQGLPVPFAQALKLTEFPFRQWYADLSKPVSIRDFAVDAKEWVKARVTRELAKGWLGGKQRLVDDIANGRKVIDTDKWHLVSEPRSYQPDLESLVSEARSQDVSLDVMDADQVNGWEYELALAKVANLVEPFHILTAWIQISLRFSLAMQPADALVADTEPEDRIDVADRWADNWGYGSAAFERVTKALKENADDIVLDIAKDALISAIPIVGWFWRAKEAIEEVSDLYDAAMTLRDARERAESAKTVVALQRAAAEISMAEYSGAATVVLTAASEGVSTGVGRLAKGKPGAEPEVGSTPGTAPAEAGGAPHTPSAAEGSAAPDVGAGRAPEAPADLVENVTPETKKMFEDNPELKKSLQDNPRAAAALKKCKSPCYPDYASEEQVARIDALLAEAEAEGYSLPQDKLAQYFRSAEKKPGLTLAEKHAALDELIEHFEEFKLRRALEDIPTAGQHVEQGEFTGGEHAGRHLRTGEYDPSVGDSARLATNLGTAKRPKPGAGYQAHHIIPSNEGPQALRDLLRLHKLDINGEHNGAWLPTGSQTRNVGGEFKHEFLTSSPEYFARLEQILLPARALTRDQVVEKLRKISTYLQLGKFPPIDV